MVVLISDQGETIRSVRLKEREGIGREERAKMDRKKKLGKKKDNLVIRTSIIYSNSSPASFSLSHAPLFRVFATIR